MARSFSPRTRLLSERGYWPGDDCLLIKNIPLAKTEVMNGERKNGRR